MSTTTPNMNLTWPTPQVDAGPGYAQLQLTAALLIDAHDHTTGRGVQVPSAGLNINADLPVNSNNLTLVRSVRFSSQSGTLSGTNDLYIVYVNGNELYYRDGTGANVKITNNGNVVGSTGSISGLSSPAAATFNSGTGTFSWTTTSGQYAKMASADLVLGAYGTSSPNQVTLKAGTPGSAYSLTLPTGNPTNANVWSVTSAGQLTCGLLDGAAATPSLSAASDLTTGFYKAASGSLGFASAAGAVLAFNASGIAVQSGKGYQGTAGDAYMKWKIFSGVLAASGTTACTPSGTLIGVAMGVGTTTSGSALITTNTATNNTYISSISGNTVNLTNGSGSLSSSYYLVVYYI